MFLLKMKKNEKAELCWSNKSGNRVCSGSFQSKGKNTHTHTLVHIDILVHTCTKSQAEQFLCRDISLCRLPGTALVAKRYRNFHKNDTLFFTLVFPVAEGVLYEMINNFNLLKLNFKASSPKEQWVLCHVQNTHIGLIFNRLCPSLKRLPWILPQSSD